jgi:3-oxoadipate enol-lactonase
LNLILRFFGIGLVAKAIVAALYGKTALKDPARVADRLEWELQLTSNRPSIWRAANGVLARKDIRGELGKISAPTLVAVGEEDIGTPLVLSEHIAAAIPGAKLVVIPRAGHGSTLEQPEAVTALISGFLQGRDARSPRGVAVA